VIKSVVQHAKHMYKRGVFTFLQYCKIVIVAFDC